MFSIPGKSVYIPLLIQISCSRCNCQYEFLVLFSVNKTRTHGMSDECVGSSFALLGRKVRILKIYSIESVVCVKFCDVTNFCVQYFGKDVWKDF
jgi:hypothetical protein